MRAICIIGSPRAQGSTSLVVERVTAGLREAGAECTLYRLHDMQIGFCRGCRACAKSGRCVQRDDIDALFDALLAADVVVIASPSYWGDVTAQLKTFIDRCTPLVDTRSGVTSVPAGKRGVAIAVRAGRSQAENQHLVDTIHHFFKHLGIEPVADLTLEGVCTPEDLDGHESALDHACRIGQELAASRPAFPDER